MMLISLSINHDPQKHLDFPVFTAIFFTYTQIRKLASYNILIESGDGGIWRKIGISWRLFLEGIILSHHGRTQTTWLFPSIWQGLTIEGEERGELDENQIFLRARVTSPVIGSRYPGERASERTHVRSCVGGKNQEEQWGREQSRQGERKGVGGGGKRLQEWRRVTTSRIAREQLVGRATAAFSIAR